MADDDDVVFFDALAALPAVDDSIAAANIDASSDAYLGPSADADDLDSASNPTGLLADGSGALGATHQGTTTPRGWVPTMSTATSRILATAYRATNPSAL